MDVPLNSAGPGRAASIRWLAGHSVFGLARGGRGYFWGRVAVIDAVSSANGKYRFLVQPLVRRATSPGPVSYGLVRAFTAG